MCPWVEEGGAARTFLAAWTWPWLLGLAAVHCAQPEAVRGANGTIERSPLHALRCFLFWEGVATPGALCVGYVGTLGVGVLGASGRSPISKRGDPHWYGLLQPTGGGGYRG